MDDVGRHTAILQAWLEQLQTTDGAAFEDGRQAVINHASDRLEKLVRKMLTNYPRLRRWEQTGDVLQNAVLRLHRSLVTIRPESVRQFYGLAATLIRRELIDLTRHHFGPEGAAARHHTDGAGAKPGSDARVESQADSRGEPSSLAEWTEFHEAVQRLPDAEREVFDLYWYEGLDQKSVASLLNVTDRTVKSRWRSAKLLLRGILADDDN
jgi:RNA polymerase sigma factor (sigma-70 family)